MSNSAKSFYLLILLLIGSTMLIAQTKQKLEDVKVSVTYANFLGKTPPIRDLVPLKSTSPEKRSLVKKNKKMPPNFGGRGKYVAVNPDALPLGGDKLRQKNYDRSGGGFFIEPIINRNGITSGSSPNDPTGDIGKDSYLQAVNATDLAVFDKEGNILGNFSANTLWSSLNFTSAGDPIILYDQEFDRWVMTEFPFQNQLLVAISETSDPLGAWSAYNFATPNFPDYPKYGVWSNSYFLTTNEQGPGTSPAYFINREQLLNGDANVMIQRIELPGVGSGPGFQVDTPVDWTGMTPPPSNAAPIVVSMVDDAWGAGLNDQIDVYSFNLDWENPDNTSVDVQNVLVAPFDSDPCSVPGFGFSCIPQLGGGGIDGIQENIMFQPHYRNFGSYEAMIMTFIVDVTDGENLSGIRWIEMRRTNGGEWTVYQEGTYAPDDGIDRFMPSIGMDGNGNIGLAYNVSSPDMYVGVRFTGRRSSDPLGQMTVTEYNVVEGTAPINSGARFGDYSHMTIDPSNDRTFWFTTEYASNFVQTRILAFELGRDTTDIGPISLVTPQEADDLTAAEVVRMEVKNYGLDTQSVFQVGYIFENGTAVTEEVNYDLYPDSTYIHTFGTTVDMNEIKAYPFKLFTALVGDAAPLNDTINTVVRKLALFDAGVADIAPFPGISCADSIPYSFSIMNMGTQDLTSATIQIDVNGSIETINWTGSLVQNTTESIEGMLTDFIGGTNQVTITVSNPNGETDQNASNDSLTASFDALIDGAAFILSITLDDYPEETTWEITDEGGTYIASGGPYPGQDFEQITETFCLDPEECYTFSMFDSYGDGICCGFGEGNYQVSDPDGAPLLVSSGEFGSEEVTQFCATFVCMMTADVDIAPESEAGAGDGSIMLSPEDGVGPYNFSIDGGTTTQENGLFTGLNAGTYDIVITGAADCIYETTVELTACAMMVSVNLMNDTTNPDTNLGAIEVSVNGGTPPYQFSIDGGQNTQAFPNFDGLVAGVYTIWVQDNLACSYEMDVEIDELVSSAQVIYGQMLEVLPNPTTAAFRINAKGIDHTRSFIDFEIFDNTGRRIQRGNLVKYDDTFTAPVTLYNYPDGVYFVRFLHDDIHQMLRIVKQQ